MFMGAIEEIRLAAKPAFWSIMFLRWDIRESRCPDSSAPRGLEMAMNAAMDTFQWGRVAVILLTAFAVVETGEAVATYSPEAIYFNAADSSEHGCGQHAMLQGRGGAGT